MKKVWKNKNTNLGWSFKLGRFVPIKIIFQFYLVSFLTGFCYKKYKFLGCYKAYSGWHLKWKHFLSLIKVQDEMKLQFWKTWSFKYIILNPVSSLHYIFSLSFCSFSYIGVYYDGLKLYVSHHRYDINWAHY